MGEETAGAGVAASGEVAATGACAEAAGEAEERSRDLGRCGDLERGLPAEGARPPAEGRLCEDTVPGRELAGEAGVVGVRAFSTGVSSDGVCADGVTGLPEPDDGGRASAGAAAGAPKMLTAGSQVSCCSPHGEHSAVHCCCAGPGPRGLPPFLGEVNAAPAGPALRPVGECDVCGRAASTGEPEAGSCAAANCASSSLTRCISCARSELSSHDVDAFVGERARRTTNALGGLKRWEATEVSAARRKPPL